MKIGLAVEGQWGLTWERWSHILALTERLGFPSLFRSDHYFVGEQRDSLEAYLSFVLAARETSRLRFGPLVTPVIFRRPVDVARMAAQIDVLSGGRFVMGLGAGWNQEESDAYGIPFPPTGERFDRLEEMINLMRAMWSPGKASYKGSFYQIEGVECMPRPASGRPHVLIGGGGEKRTLRLVAQNADEWHCGTSVSPEVYSHKKAVLELHCEALGRDPNTIAHSMSAFAIMGPDGPALDLATQRVMQMFPPRTPRSLEEYRERAKARGMIVGQTEEVVDQLGRLAELGMQEIQFQHLDLDSDEIPAYLASEIAPRVAGL